MIYSRQEGKREDLCMYMYMEDMAVEGRRRMEKATENQFYSLTTTNKDQEKRTCQTRRTRKGQDMEKGGQEKEEDLVKEKCSDSRGRLDSESLVPDIPDLEGQDWTENLCLGQTEEGREEET